MDIRVTKGSITETKSDALIVNLFEGVTSPGGATGAVDKALGGMISRLIAEKEISGKLMDTTLIHTNGKIAPARVLVIGLGKSKDFDLRIIRKVAGAAAKFLKGRGVSAATTIVHGAGIGGIDTKYAARAVVEGTIIGLYSGDIYKKKEEEKSTLTSLVIVERDSDKIPDIKAGADAGKILAEATNEARTLGNEPANIMTPSVMAEHAKAVAERYGLEYKELDEKQMSELGMEGILSVARGSVQPPKMMIIKYNAGKKRRTVAFVGKAITFDSGGISIKPSNGMETMKFDMSGGGAVINTMSAIAQLKPDINVLGIVPATENMPGGAAYRPGDVVKCYSGKTVEIITTDAEGRMILADAITYAVNQGADYIVDIATLTGSCVVALGNDITGIMGNDRDLIEKIKATAKISGERVWELPMPPDYIEMLKSPIADINNAGSRWGGAIYGGMFLQEFVEDKPWVHMDIAGTAYISKSDGGPANSDKYMASGATGVGVRTLALLAVGLSKD